MVRVNKYRIINGEKEQYKTFQCSTHRNYNDLCDTRNIAENVLCDILYATIQKHLSFIKGIKKQVQRNVQYSFEEKLKQAESKKQKVINLKKLSGTGVYADIFGLRRRLCFTGSIPAI